MNPIDRSVSLAELAARAKTAAATKQRSNCKNPECQNGFTPGLVAAGGGNKAQPLFGAGGVGAKRLMKWSWVPCLACSATEDQRRSGAIYRHLNLTEQQISQRAQMATSRASYQEAPKPAPSNRAPARDGFVSGSADGGKLTEMIEQNKQLSARVGEMLKQNVAMTDTLSRMSVQVAALLEDNAKLREQLAKPTPVTAERVQGTLSLPSKVP